MLLRPLLLQKKTLKLFVAWHSTIMFCSNVRFSNVHGSFREDGGRGRETSSGLREENWLVSKRTPKTMKVSITSSSAAKAVAEGSATSVFVSEEREKALERESGLRLVKDAHNGTVEAPTNNHGPPPTAALTHNACLRQWWRERWLAKKGAHITTRPLMMVLWISFLLLWDSVACLLKCSTDSNNPVLVLLSSYDSTVNFVLKNSRGAWPV